MQDKILTCLLQTDSTTHSTCENNMAQVILKLIEEQPYFAQRKDQYGLYEIGGDVLKRSIPWALYRAKDSSRQTIVLAGHMDTVSTDNYGTLKSCALMPTILENALRDEALPSKTKEDLESGEWIFGRGTADMKGGLSVLMEELFQSCETESLSTNLLFIAVPDEETYSVGMRSATALLLRLKNQFNLEYQCMVMSESHLREDGQSLYFDGTIGKLQINIVVKGVPVHARLYYTGMNPVQLASQIACDLDGNAAFSEQVGEEKTPPPCIMYYRDTKKRYDVTLPESIDMAISFLTYQRTGKQILEAIKEQINHSIDAVMNRIHTQYQSWASSLPAPAEQYEHRPKVLFYEELVTLAEQKGSTDFWSHYQAVQERISEQLKCGSLNFNDATLGMVHEILDYVDSTEPAVILAITPPLYPGFTNRDIAPEGSFVLELPDKLCQFSQEEGQPARFEHYFAGISDLSYAATTYKEAERRFINKNMPVWGDNYSIDFDGIAKLQIPVFNVGPWGKSIHTKFERVNRYSLLHECPTLIHWLLLQLDQHNHK